MLALALTIVAAAPIGARVELVFGGDVIPHEAVKETAAAWARTADGQSQNHDGWDHVFGPLSEALRGADAAIVNLETPLTDNRRAVTEELVFNAPSALASGLKAAGVTVATFANNHCLDQHREGIVETRRHLAAAGLDSAGAAHSLDAAWEPLVFTKNELTVCVLAFTRFLNGFHNLPDAQAPHVPIVHYDSDPTVGGISEKSALALVQRLSQRCDALVVTPHWGDEYRDTPNANDRRFAWALLEAGAVAVVGSHPHVIQTVEGYARPDGRMGLTAYSLGNLVSNQGSDEPDSPTREGLLLRLSLEQTDRGVTVAAAQALPVCTENRADKRKRRNVQPVLLDAERRAVTEQLATLQNRSDPKSGAQARALTRRLQLLERRRERIERILPLDVYDSSMTLTR